MDDAVLNTPITVTFTGGQWLQLAILIHVGLEVAEKVPTISSCIFPDIEEITKSLQAQLQAAGID